MSQNYFCFTTPEKEKFQSNSCAPLTWLNYYKQEEILLLGLLSEVGATPTHAFINVYNLHTGYSGATYSQTHSINQTINIKTDNWRQRELVRLSGIKWKEEKKKKVSEGGANPCMSSLCGRTPERVRTPKKYKDAAAMEEPRWKWTRLAARELV